MEAEIVDRFLLANEHKFPDYEVPIHRLLSLPPEKESLLKNTHFLSPGKLLLISILFGFLGLDRFLLRDWWKGFGKILIGGGLGIWFFVDQLGIADLPSFPEGLGCLFIIDWFLIMGATKKKNMEKLESLIKD